MSKRTAKKCRWCGNEHGALCHDVKAIEYHANGRVRRVEFKTASDYIPMSPSPAPSYPLPIGPSSPPYPQPIWQPTTICTDTTMGVAYGDYGPVTGALARAHAHTH